MKKLIIPCAFLLIGAISGFLVSSYIENQNKRNLYKSFYIIGASDSVRGLSRQNLEDIKQYLEQQFKIYLMNISTLTDPKNKGKIDWKYYKSVEEMGGLDLRILFKSTRDINKFEFSSEEVKREIVELLEQIKSNNL